ncbi:hypothetical protein GQ457_01G013000 [Hibiscus cannabinus]
MRFSGRTKALRVVCRGIGKTLGMVLSQATALKNHNPNKDSTHEEALQCKSINQVLRETRSIIGNYKKIDEMIVEEKLEILHNCAFGFSRRPY